MQGRHPHHRQGRQAPYGAAVVLTPRGQRHRRLSHPHRRGGWRRALRRHSTTPHPTLPQERDGENRRFRQRAAHHHHPHAATRGVGIERIGDGAATTMGHRHPPGARNEGQGNSDRSLLPRAGEQIGVRAPLASTRGRWRERQQRLPATHHRTEGRHRATRRRSRDGRATRDTPDAKQPHLREHLLEPPPPSRPCHPARRIPHHRRLQTQARRPALGAHTRKPSVDRTTGGGSEHLMGATGERGGMLLHQPRLHRPRLHIRHRPMPGGQLHVPRHRRDGHPRRFLRGESEGGASPLSPTRPAVPPSGHHQQPDRERHH